ncbi:MAG TPA: ceramide glucosyltransferase [Xanthobacteraceae bacterium]|nr:ceramide glucosyltransferase [Xanthobacteraceae bacterium]
MSIVRPICGLDPFLEETLRTSFELAYPTYELIFCIASTRDPAIPIVQNLMAMHRHVDAQLLVGDDRISQNPKLNNCVKGWRAAKYDWIVLADSNVLMPVDYINRLLDAWEPDTGLVCSPPVGCRAMGFWAGLECAFLNTYQVRVQYFADALGFGFAQGKTMLWRRAELEAAGGIGALATEIAEDAASTKIVRAASLRVRLATPPFEQPLGRRRIAEVWRRQTRWARLRRSSFPLYFVPEIFSGAVFPLIAAGYVASTADISAFGTIAALSFIWCGAETALAKAAGWQPGPLYPLQAILRDLLLPVLWIDAWVGTDFVWRGHQMSIAADASVR